MPEGAKSSSPERKEGKSARGDRNTSVKDEKISTMTSTEGRLEEGEGGAGKGATAGEAPASILKEKKKNKTQKKTELRRVVTEEGGLARNAAGGGERGET